MDFNFLKKEQIRIGDMFSNIALYFSNVFGQIGARFTVSSAFGQILFAITQISQLIFYYIEDAITESTINATRNESIYGLARLAGHNPSRSNCATGTISVSFNNTVNTIPGNYILVHNYTTITCLNNNLKYLINLPYKDFRIPLNSSQKVELNVIQGVFETQTFTGNGTSLQSFEINMSGNNRSSIDNQYINVYVNGELWKKYNSIYDIGYNRKGYLCQTGISSGIDIYFGNNYNGMIPPDGAIIKVEYLKTEGLLGNIQSNYNSMGIQFEFIDLGYDIYGNEINLNDYFDININTPIGFGTGGEDVNLTKLLMTKVSKSFVLATADNFITFFEKFNYFSIIDAFSLFNDEHIENDNIIYLFLVPDVHKRLLTNENYFTTSKDNFKLTDGEMNSLYKLIDESGQKILTCEVVIIEPVIQKYVTNIVIRVFEKYDAIIIKNKIVEKLSDYFLKIRRRDIIPRSDLIGIIENIEGVDSVNVFFISERNENYHRNNVNFFNYDSSKLIGLTNDNDILINDYEDDNYSDINKNLIMLRGGWYDRFGVQYLDEINFNKPSIVNIEIVGVTANSINTEINNNLKKTL